MACKFLIKNMHFKQYDKMDGLDIFLCGGVKYKLFNIFLLSVRVFELRHIFIGYI